MDDILCGLSALRYHRTPPLALMAYPAVFCNEPNHTRIKLFDCPLIRDIIGRPLYVLATSQSERTGSQNIKRLLFSGELPFGSIIEDEELCISITSPLMTLFTLSRSISDVHLLMAMYEFCGCFAVFRPTKEIETFLSQGAATMRLGSTGGWRRVCDASGKPTDLWKRPPLIEIDELRAFAREMESAYGGKRFAIIAQKVTGVTASPFEAQTSMLLGLSRGEGGMGLGGFANNHEIRLTRNMQKIADKTRVFADLYYEGGVGRAPLVIECQGGAVHSGDAAAMSDADRATALQGMGIDVMLLTYKQIAHPDNFRQIAQHIAAKLGRPCREKMPRLLMKEGELRRELFIDWLTLGE